MFPRFRMANWSAGILFAFHGGPDAHAPASKMGTVMRATFLAGVILSRASGQTVQPDQIFLRDGRTIWGNIVGETSDTYRALIPAIPSPLLTNVAVQAVRYVVYGTSAKARTALRLEETARALGANDSAEIRFLPTESFGEAIAEAAASAQSRVWILAYFISGGGHPAIQNFYSSICAKARAGLDVRVISEFGKGTPMPIRNATLNYAQTLQDDGLLVRFIQEYYSAPRFLDSPIR